MTRSCRSLVVTVLTALVTAGTSLALAAPAAAAPSGSFPGCPVLREGMRHVCVQRLHAELVAYYPGYHLNTTATFYGAATRVAVLDYQRRRGIRPDGAVGADTARQLLNDGATPPRPAPAPSGCGTSTTPSTIPPRRC